MHTRLPTPVPTDVDALADRIAETAAHIDAATHTLLTHIREFDLLEGWHSQGALSCAHWLNWRIGLDLGAAREKVRVARALASLPLIDEALRRGEVSYSKVRAMSRVAMADNEAELLEMARCSTASQLERICRLFRQVQGLSPEEARERDERRRVTWRESDDGMVSIQIRLPPEEATVVLEALRVSAETSGDDLADGAVAMAEAVLRGDAPNRTPTDVTLHVDAERFEGRLPDGTGLSAETTRRLCCDAGIAPLVVGAGGALQVGRKTRTIPAAMKRALVARDAGCRFPGCTNQRTDGHHLRHWADGGETTLTNMLSLCRRHHRYVHEYGYSVVHDEVGDVAFLDPGGDVIPAVGPAASNALRRFPDLSTRNGWNQATAERNEPAWDDRPPDYGLAVVALLAASDR